MGIGDWVGGGGGGSSKPNNRGGWGSWGYGSAAPTPAPQPQQPSFLGDFADNLAFNRSYYAPTFAGIEAENAAAAGRLGAIQGAAGAGAGAARAQADIRRRQLDNQIASVGVDLNAIPRQTNLLDQLLALTGKGHTADLTLVDQLDYLSGRTLGNQLTDINNAELTQTRRHSDDATARGAGTAIGTRWGYQDIMKEASSGREKAHIQRAETEANLANRRTNLMLDWEAAQLTTGEQKAKLKDREQQLQLQADNYRLDQDALLAGLDAQLASMNLQGILSAGQVLDGINSRNTQKAQLMNEIVYGAVQSAYQSGSAQGGYPQGATSPSVPMTGIDKLVRGATAQYK